MCESLCVLVCISFSSILNPFCSITTKPVIFILRLHGRLLCYCLSCWCVCFVQWLHTRPKARDHDVTLTFIASKYVVLMAMRGTAWCQIDSQHFSLQHITSLVDKAAQEIKITNTTADDKNEHLWCFDCRCFEKCLSKKKQRNTSVGCPVGPDNPEVYASLLAEHHRMHIG